VSAPFESIDHIQLAMPRGLEQEARGFYAGILGMAEIPKPPELRERGGVWFQSGTVALHLGADPDFRPATKAHPALRCTDYAALVRRLEKHGVVILHDERLIDGKAHCYVADPFGNRLELMQS
jgi:catechol 2,3-dioxygenase-like lactoylglutathione lyase family enzyme